MRGTIFNFSSRDALGAEAEGPPPPSGALAAEADEALAAETEASDVLAAEPEASEVLAPVALPPWSGVFASRGAFGPEAPSKKSAGSEEEEAGDATDAAPPFSCFLGW